MSRQDTSTDDSQGGSESKNLVVSEGMDGFLVVSYPRAVGDVGVRRKHVFGYIAFEGQACSRATQLEKKITTYPAAPALVLLGGL